MELTAEKIVRMGRATPESESTYSDVRQLPDGTWCCLGHMLFTTAILVDVSMNGYDHRFCFERRSDALRELQKMTTIDSEPQGYIVRK